MRVIKAVCRRAAVMDDGKVIETGEVFDIFSNPLTATTRDFIATTSSLHKIYELLAENSPIVKLKRGEILARFSYIGRSAVEALISTVSIRYSILVNIIFGDLEIIQDTPIGGLIVILSGEERNILQAVSWIVDNGVKVEVIKND
jgi:D-methionine transport system ATP-binding protein